MSAAALTELGPALRGLGAPAPVLAGRVLRYDGVIVECGGFAAPPGTLCEIEAAGDAPVRGEIVGFSNGRNIVILSQPNAPVTADAWVRVLPGGLEARVGPALLGRVIDADGAPLDGGPAPDCTGRLPLLGRALNPLARQPVSQPLDVGVRLINAALTVGKGQRLGIVAGSGVGKSVLIEMMTRNTAADVVVIGLIGERAREVGAFLSHIMQGETAARCCVVAVPADRSPLMRLRAANRATAIAEHFRDAGKQVLLIMDSLTRVAHARREIGLAMGEQPTAKGYPPSVISLIPSLIERAGPGLPGAGAITAFYTVLADGDDTNDPVVDAARAILDGHIVLSRKQAQMGIYPAIDLPQSVSRVMSDIVDAEHERAGRALRRMVALYQENRDMMLMGAYAPGSDPELDRAVALWPRIEALIAQDRTTPADLEGARAALIELAGEQT